MCYSLKKKNYPVHEIRKRSPSLSLVFIRLNLFLSIPFVLKNDGPLLFVQSHFNPVDDVRICMALAKTCTFYSFKAIFIETMWFKMISLTKTYMFYSLKAIFIQFMRFEREWYFLSFYIFAQIHFHSFHVVRNRMVLAETYTFSSPKAIHTQYIRFEEGWRSLRAICFICSNQFSSCPWGSNLDHLR